MLWICRLPRVQFSSRRRRIIGVALAGLMLSSLWAGDGRTLAQNTPATKTKADEAPRKSAPTEPFDLSYVGSEATVIVGVRPSRLTAQPGMQDLAAFLNRDDLGDGLERSLGIPAQAIEQAVFWSAATSIGTAQSGAAYGGLIRTSSVSEFEALKSKTIRAADMVEKTHNGRSYYRSAWSDWTRAAFVADERTLVLGSEENIKALLDAPGADPAQRDWLNGWDDVRSDTLACAIHVEMWRARFAEARRNSPNPLAALLSPVVEHAQGVVVGLDTNDKLTLRLQANCATPEDAARVKKALEAFVAHGRDMLDEAQLRADRAADDPTVVLLRPLLNMGRQLVTAARIEQDQSVVTLRSEMPGDYKTLANIVLPWMRESRTAARQMQARNSLKQIGLALHNYHDKHNCFPPAVVLGPDGKTPHSWRVELLPFLGAEALYKQYRQDEPWDSPHNKALLARIPAVYRSPLTASDTTDTAYFVMTGPNTAFREKPSQKGIPIREITDGTSNTIAVVEAKRSIPWTKPEDIPADFTQPLPLGGYQPKGFLALLCDGSVRLISQDIDKTLLRSLLTRNGGEVIGEF